MTQDFDKLISDSAPDVPDSGASRRMTRALLHEKMRHQERRSRNRDRRGMSLAASLVFLFVIGGQATQLGSDGFEFEISSHEIEVSPGQTVQVISSPIRGPISTTISGMNDDDYREIQMQAVANEGNIVTLDGYALGEETPFWMIGIERNINGKIITEGLMPTELSVPSKMPGRDKLPFLTKHLDKFLDQLENGELKGRPFGLVSADGTQFQVQVYTRTYPGWGLFTYYRGYPLKP